MRRLSLLLLLVPALASASALDANAYGETAIHKGDPRVSASLLVDAREAAPGDTVRVGIKLQLDEGWHVYWRNPGEAGLPTELGLQLEGATVGPLQEPFPATFRDNGGTIITYGWDREVLLFREVTLPATASGQVELQGQLSLLACEDLCIPGRLSLERTLPIGPTTLPSESAPEFEAAAATVPRTQEAITASVQVKEGEALVAGQPFTGEIRLACAESGTCADWKLASTDAVVADAPPGLETSRTPGSGPLSAKLEGKVARDAKDALVLTGVALFEDASGARHPIEWRAPLGTATPAPAEVATAAAGPTLAAPEPPPGAPVAPTGEGTSVGLMLVLAFLGGALLNLMPCVFPVLALKVFSFLKLVGGTRRQAALHAGAYTLGIQAALLALAAVVLAVRAAGTQVGWGFQFQEPLFVAVITALLVVFALNLFGVFQIGSDAGALAAGVERTQGLGRSVGEGMLAVVLATPCSAPFLGTAMGFGLSAPALVVVAIFVALGLGLAAPFVVLVLVPTGVKWLPKPGAWMDTGKQLLGFALLGTAAWLAWVLGQLAGVDGIGRLLAFLVAAGMAAWMWGQAQQARNARVWQVLALVVLVGSGAATLRFSPVGTAAAAPAGSASAAAPTGPWQPYSEAKLQEALAAGRPVFVDFTADWCITCKFNEKNVLDQPTVQEAFAAADTLLLKVDFTRKDEAIAKMLAQHGRAGVPLYLLYSPGGTQPKILPELLSESVVIEALLGEG